MLTIIAGFIISLVTEAAKRIQAVPVTPEQTTRIRAIAAVLSILSTLGVAYLNGTLTQATQAAGFVADLNVAIYFIGSSLITWFTSVLAYHSLVKTVPPDAPTE